MSFKIAESQKRKKIRGPDTLLFTHPLTPSLKNREGEPDLERSDNPPSLVF